MAELPTTEPEEEKLYAGNAEADVEICGGLDEHSQQQHPDSVLMELERAKSKLNRTTILHTYNEHANTLFRGDPFSVEIGEEFCSICSTSSHRGSPCLG
ncbi:uncharacterized protein LOC124698176 isoform X2 [Lolium rigidum]|uniref:uncharacterized protein LOC124698176 isoform X2 n=1 Tax=Lolium rigidum TaxID=89674 RepID=UPI001F5C7D75|nr:uncharacterized protein LOC124698176 isoform X2 [Lolium rigidum]